MADFESFFKTLKSDTFKLITEHWSSYKDVVEKAIKKYLDNSKGRLKKWFEQLAKGEITKDQFELLLKGSEDLAQITALEQLGLAHVEVENIKSGVINLIIGSVFKTILK